MSHPRDWGMRTSRLSFLNANDMHHIKTAILVDGGFYRRISQTLWGKKTAADRAAELHAYCFKHRDDTDGDDTKRDLYRIFYYDCPPLDEIIYNPLSKKNENFGQRDTCRWTLEFFRELSRKRKVAIRLGRLSKNEIGYRITPEAQKKLLAGKLRVDDLTEHDVRPSFGQKGVDVKIGLDILHLAYKRLVDQIILVSGDSDFVPAAKLARREGVDFILDPMGTHVADDLMEHVDGLKTHVEKKSIKRAKSRRPSPPDAPKG